MLKQVAPVQAPSTLLGLALMLLVLCCVTQNQKRIFPKTAVESLSDEIFLFISYSVFKLSVSGTEIVKLPAIAFL